MADGAEAGEGGGLTPMTENTVPVDSKSQATTTVIFHCVNAFKFVSHTSAATWPVLFFFERFQV